MKAELEIQKKELEQVFEKFKIKAEERIVAQLTEIGKKSVEIARNLPNQGKTYHNRTGKLRDSIGFAVLKNGNIVAEDFVDPIGRSAVMNRAGESYDGFRLLIVAGAEYATDVHVRGYDVLDSALINAEKQFQDWINKQK